MADYSMVKDLTPWEEFKQTIKVKVLKRWDTVDSEGHEGMYFILVDEMGSRVAAMVNDFKLSYYKRVFQEGAWLRLSQFRLVNSGWNERTTNHAYKIILNQSSKVNYIRPLSQDLFIKIVDFPSVYNRPSHYYPIDVMGIFDKEIGNVVEDFNDENSVSTLHFRIMDIEGNTLNCVAHGDLAYDIKEKSNCELLKGPYPICVLTD
ncbi:uncharacterized protein LOC112084491 [Eutrema salsugineum]|uniref:uncharacterized protein LOC112084491 n=1 Tax=Eutrema salsugineum TaxID=72664 RepID=UPI000CED12AE|nr:uncharacterized protein LOC112084491 [Eutrema salsugineum]